MTSGPGSAARPTRAEQQRQLLDLFREVGGDRQRVAARLGLEPEVLEQRLRKLGLLRQIASLSRQEATVHRVRVRKSGERPLRARPTAPVPPPLPKRGAGRPPRGRLTLGAAAQRDRAELTSEKGRALLRELIAAHRGDRPTLLRRLHELYGSPSQHPLTVADLENLLQRHNLQEEVEAASRQRLQMLLQQHRGDLQRMAGALKVTRQELRHDLERRGLWELVERARDRYRREIFAKPLAEQAFLLLKRRSSLTDLAALEPLERELGTAARTAWEKAQAPTRTGRVARLAALMALSDEQALSLVEHFALE